MTVVLDDTSTSVECVKTEADVINTFCSQPSAIVANWCLFHCAIAEITIVDLKNLWE